MWIGCANVRGSQVLELGFWEGYHEILRDCIARAWSMHRGNLTRCLIQDQIIADNKEPHLYRIPG